MISQVRSAALRGEDCDRSVVVVAEGGEDSSRRAAVRPREIRICDVSRNFSEEEREARVAVWLDRMLDLLFRRRRGGSTEEEERTGDTEGEESAGQCAVRPRALAWNPSREYDILGVGGDAFDIITSDSRVLVVADGGWKDEDV
jgi:hypothetical protein